MKRKELLKRLSAVSIAMGMAVTTIPSSAFAAEVGFSDGGQEIAVQSEEETEFDVEITDVETETVAEEDVSVEMEGEIVPEEETDEFAALFSSDAPAAASINGDVDLLSEETSEIKLSIEGKVGEKAITSVVETGETVLYSKENWDVIDMTYQGDSTESGKQLIKLKTALTAPEGCYVQIGTGYNSSKKILNNILTADEEGYVSSSSACITINTPPKKETKALYAIVYDENGNAKAYYKLNIVRKGYKAVFVATTASSYGSSPSNPYALGISWAEDVGIAAQKTSAGSIGSCITFYDENGDKITIEKSKIPDQDGGGTTEINMPGVTSLPEGIWMNDRYCYAKYPGLYEITGEYEGQKLSYYVRSSYTRARGLTVIDRCKTNGTINLFDFESAEAFAAAFPQEWKEKAAKLYTLLSEAKEVYDTGLDGKEGGWDWSIALANKDTVGWSEESESAKVGEAAKIVESGIWDYYYYDLKDELEATRNDIQNYLNTDKLGDKKEEADTCISETLEKIDAAYKNGTLSEEMLKELRETTLNSLDEMAKAVYAANSFTAALDTTEFIYDGNAKEPVVAVADADGKTLSKIYYKVTYKNNTNAGTAQAIVTGRGKYEGVVKILDFTIAKAAQTLTVAQTAYTLNRGEASKAISAVVDSGMRLSYESSNADVAIVTSKGKIYPVGRGKAEITVSSSETGNYKASAVVKITVTVNDYVSLSVSKASVSKKYNSKAFSLGAKTESGAKLTYKTSNKNVVAVSSKGKVTVKAPGVAVITVTASKNNKDSVAKKVTIKITPKTLAAPTLKSSKSKQLKVSWKRDKSVTGYEVIVSTDKNFKKNVVKTQIKKNGTTSATIKKLSGGKKYYVKVRSYKATADGTVYGSWSKSKNVKIKK